MTTIVGCTRTGVLASDTFTSNSYRAAKVFRTKREGLFGCAGDDRLIARFEDWKLRRGKRPELLSADDEFEGLQLHENCLYLWGSAMRRELILSPYDAAPAQWWAVGSGGHLAIATLAQGGTVIEALRMAELFDSGTRAPFQFIKERE